MTNTYAAARAHPWRAAGLTLLAFLIAITASLVSRMDTNATPASNFMESGNAGGDGNVRDTDGSATVAPFDWGNNGTGAANTCPAAASGFTIVNLLGAGGLFNCGQFKNNTTTPLAPVATAMGTPGTACTGNPPCLGGTNDIKAAAFGVDPLGTDIGNCSPSSGGSTAPPCVSPQITCSGTGDPTVYTGAGGEKNGDPLNGKGVETFSYSSVPGKDELTNVYAALRRHESSPGVEDLHEIFFGGDRVINNGESHIDFEFLQAPVGLVVTSPCSSSNEGQFNGHRSQGDFVASIEYTKGGSLGGFELNQWHCKADTHSADSGSGWVSSATQSAQGTQCDDSTAHYQLVACLALPGATACPPIDVSALPGASGFVDAVHAVTNGTGPVACGGWVCRDGNGNSVANIDTNELMEGSVNLLSIGFTGCISTFVPHTRTSQSFTSTLKDFALIPFRTCTSSLVTNIHDASDNDVTGGTVPSGTAVHDTATLTVNGSGASPTGSITFTRYSTSDCTGAAAATETVNLPANASNPVTVSATGATATTATAALSYKASYSGDSTYPAVPASAVACEPLGITTASLVTNIIRNDLSTDVTGSTVPKGTIVHDTATVTGSGDGTTKPTGTITFQLFATNDCTGSHTDEAVTPLTSGTGTTATAASGNTTANAALSYKATYSGDSVYPAVTAANVTCEPLGITTASLVTNIIRNDLSTDVTGSTVPKGTIVHDTATVTGSGDGTTKPTGTITFQLFATIDCTGSHTDEAVTPLTPGTGTTATAASGNTTANAALSYKATYSGDNVYPPVTAANVTCEPLGITTASLVTNIIRNDLGTNVTNSTVPTGTVVHDTATVTGSGDGTTKPTGTITFELFATNDCTGSHTDQAVTPLTPGAGTTATAASSNTTASAALSYKATYSGDTVYPPVGDTAVTCEPLGVTTSSLVTNIIRNDLGTDVTGSTVPKGTIVHDTATVTGSGDGSAKPTGTVTFELFATIGCTGSHTDEAITPITPDTGTVSTAASSDTTVNAALSYKASYSGDTNYPPVSDANVTCEPLGIATSSLVTNIIRDDLGTDVTNSTVPKGVTTVHDTATVTGSGDGTNKPTGTVTFELFATSDCTGSHVDEAVTPLTPGAGTTATAASSSTAQPVSAPLSYKASYSGDTVYPPVSADAVSCESLTVTTSSLVTHIVRNSDGSDVTGKIVLANTVVHDTATVTGAGDGSAKPTGTITFQLFATLDCTGSHTDEAISPITGDTGTTATAASSDHNATASLSYKATYSGDTVYPPVTADNVTCEPLTVINPSTLLSIADRIVGLLPDTTGTVTYGAFLDSGCQNPVTTGTPSDGNITPNPNTVGAGGIAPLSLLYTPDAPGGTFYVKATFTGTGVYAGVTFVSCTEHAVITD